MFAGLGLAIIAVGIALAIIGSFAYVGALSVGLFFIAAALVGRAVRSPAHRVAAVLGLAAVAVLTFGLVATPLFYAGWGLLAGAAALALVFGRR